MATATEIKLPMVFNKFFSGLKKTRQAISEKLTGLTSIFARGKNLDPETLEQLEEALIMADVGASAAPKIIEELKKKAADDDAQVALAKIIAARFAQKQAASENHTKPHIVLIVGVNGSGKTTTIAKLANREIQSKGKVVLGAADTFRAAAGEQLEIWAERVGAELIKQASGSDPAAVAFDAVKAAMARNADLVLIDTAGRLQTKTNLMEELKKIHRVVAKAMPGAPHEVLLVMDATTGQNGLSQIELFNSAVGLTGIVMTKLDGTAKGGILVAAIDKYGIPIKYVGLGEGRDDLVDFDPMAFAEALVGIGGQTD
jgi:fused signal recognition particle receptor